MAQQILITANRDKYLTVLNHMPIARAWVSFEFLLMIIYCQCWVIANGPGRAPVGFIHVSMERK